MRRRVLSGEWPVGSRLPPERELAQAMGASRSTLREALRRLQAANLVAATPGQGNTVLDFRRAGSCELLEPFLRHASDPSERARVLLDALALRARLAEIVVELATVRASEADLARLDAIVVEAAAADARRDPVALAGAQVEWNDALVEATHNVSVRWLASPVLAALREVLPGHARLVLFQPSFAQHALVVRGAIGDRDVRAAVGATRGFYDTVDPKLRWALQPIASAVPSS